MRTCTQRNQPKQRVGAPVLAPAGSLVIRLRLPLYIRSVFSVRLPACDRFLHRPVKGKMQSLSRACGCSRWSPSVSVVGKPFVITNLEFRMSESEDGLLF